MTLQPLGVTEGQVDFCLVLFKQMDEVAFVFFLRPQNIVWTTL